MALISEVLNGFSKRIRLENHIMLQRAMQARPKQVQLEVAKIWRGIEEELKDAELKTQFDLVKIDLPENI